MELHQIHFRLWGEELQVIKWLGVGERRDFGCSKYKEGKAVGCGSRHFPHHTPWHLKSKSNLLPLTDTEVLPDADAGLGLVQGVEVQPRGAGF